MNPNTFSYSRAQAIEDGVLVDLTKATDDAGQLLCRQHFKFPVAMTRATYAETIEAGGTYGPDPEDPEMELLTLPPGQDYAGRLWDVLWMLRCAIKAGSGGDRVAFQVSVFDGRRQNTVKLWSLCGPGDDAEPVITIMLEGED